MPRGIFGAVCGVVVGRLTKELLPARIVLNFVANLNSLKSAAENICDGAGLDHRILNGSLREIHTPDRLPTDGGKESCELLQTLSRHDGVLAIGSRSAVDLISRIVRNDAADSDDPLAAKASSKRHIGMILCTEEARRCD